MTATMEIKRDPRGYYTLLVNGMFAGNFDSISEAAQEYEDLYSSFE